MFSSSSSSSSSASASAIAPPPPPSPPNIGTIDPKEEGFAELAEHELTNRELGSLETETETETESNLNNLAIGYCAFANGQITSSKQSSQTVNSGSCGIQRHVLFLIGTGLLRGHSRRTTFRRAYVKNAFMFGHMLGYAGLVLVLNRCLDVYVLSDDDNEEEEELGCCNLALLSLLLLLSVATSRRSIYCANLGLEVARSQHFSLMRLVFVFVLVLILLRSSNSNVSRLHSLRIRRFRTHI